MKIISDLLIRLWPIMLLLESCVTNNFIGRYSSNYELLDIRKDSTFYYSYGYEEPVKEGFGKWIKPKQNEILLRFDPNPDSLPFSVLEKKSDDPLYRTIKIFLNKELKDRECWVVLDSERYSLDSNLEFFAPYSKKYVTVRVEIGKSKNLYYPNEFRSTIGTKTYSLKAGDSSNIFININQSPRLFFTEYSDTEELRLGYKVLCWKRNSKWIKFKIRN